MKILLLIGSLQGGGAERQVRYLAPALAQRGDEVTIALLQRGQHQQSLGEVPIVALRTGSGVLGAVRRFRRLARSQDIVYSLLDVANAFATISLLGAPVPHVWGLRNSGVSRSLAARLGFRLSRALSQRAAAAICNSQAVREFYRRRGFRPKQFAVIGNGVDVQRFHPRHRNPATLLPLLSGLHSGPLREQARDSLRGPLIGMIARPEPFKRHDLFAQMIAELLEDHPQVVGVIAGLGSDQSNPYIADLLDRFDVRGRVLALGEVRDVPVLMATLDIVVCCSDFEGSSNSVLEALASGVPVVSFAVGDAVPMLRSGGVVVTERSARALARAITPLLEDAGRRAQLGRAGRRTAETHYSIDRFVCQTRALLAQCAAAL